MTLDLPDDASPKVVEALEEIVARFRDKFTGRVSFDFKGGEPLSRQYTITKRLGLIVRVREG